MINTMLRPQCGMSLISLMVGLLLSMISILAGVMLYQNMARVSIESRTDAIQDGQLASAMLALQLELQSAGYGIDPEAPGTHIQRVVEGTTQTLYWRYRETAPAGFVCRAFRIEDIDNNSRRQLQLLAPVNAASCTADAALPALAGEWAATSVQAEFRASAAGADSLPAIAITLAPRTCFPYGMGEPGDYQMVTITADNAARRAAVDEGTAAPNDPFVYDFCLPNLRANAP
ncbi:MAG: hypothetical protein U1B30_10895 [Pseudomonadota bacterium]|nr:hypothetical protein [Pseudomonadota bacterium]